MPEQIASNPLDILLDERRKGRSYDSLAKEFNVSAATVGRICRDAGLGSGRIQVRLPTEVYRAGWIARVKARCVIDSNGCWLWQGFKGEKGYGSTAWRRRSISVHRGMYIEVHGVKLSTEQVVCHSCDVRHCCNPDHLWLGTAADNVMDSAIKKRHGNAKKTHCKRGHPLSGDNLEVWDGLRRCVICQRGRMRLRAGWPEAEAFTLPPIPQNAPTPRRWKGKAA